MRLLFLFFIIMPILEMLLLFEVSDHIGGLSTVGLVVLTAAIGIQVLKQQGISTITRAQQRLQTGQLPAQEIIEGLFLAVGGAFLLTPGFITDTLGFIFLIGPSRRLLVKSLIKSGKVSMFSAGTGFQGAQGFSYRQHSSRSGFQRDDGDIFEGEFARDDKPRTGLPDSEKK